MFATYLRRELSRRRRQSIIVAVGMALAIALVITVNALAAGVKDAQAASLAQLYGVGTDITLQATPVAPGEGGGPGRQFDFGAQDGATADGTTSVSQSRLELARGSAALSADTVTTASATDGVAAAVGVLALENTTFSGELPDFSQMQQRAPTDGQTGAGDGQTVQRPQGGPDGAGGSSFDVDSFSVLGLDPTAATLGPLTATTLTEGRTLSANDTAADVAVLDSAYATEAGLAVGGTVNIGGTPFEIVGLVTSTASDGSSASDVYIPLQVAQTLSSHEGMVSSVYVQAASTDSVDAVKTSLEAALPDTTVSTQSDLASNVSGSVSSAAGLITGLGTWLSILALIAAFAVAVLFTVSGVARRTREFGTLKALGWSDRRVVGQVAGESLVQGTIGGVAGVALGLLGILIVNLIAPTISSTATAATAAGPGGGGGMPGGPGGASGFGGTVAQTVTTLSLHLPVTVGIIGLALGIAVLGGLLAGAFGGWRAAKLRPAAAFRSID